MSKSLMLALAVALLGAGSSAAMAQQASKQSSKPPANNSTAKQQTVTMREQKPGLLAQAKVPADSATKLASAKLPSEKIVREEIRQDSSGKLLYTFAFKNASKSGVDVIHVDANSGTVSEVKHMDRSSKGHAQHSDSAKTKSST